MKEAKLLLVIIMTILMQTNVTKASTSDEYKSVVAELSYSLKYSNYKKLACLLKEDAFQKISVGQILTTHGKGQLIHDLKKQGTQLNCEVVISYLSTSNAIVVARMDLVFKEFTVHNYVTLEKNNWGKWKVASISKMYNSIGITEKSIANSN